MVCTIKEFPCFALAFLGLIFSVGGSRMIGDSCCTVILKVKVRFNHFKKHLCIIVKSNEKLRDKSIVCCRCLEIYQLMISTSRFPFPFFLLGVTSIMVR